MFYSVHDINDEPGELLFGFSHSVVSYHVKIFFMLYRTVLKFFCTPNTSKLMEQMPGKDNLNAAHLQAVRNKAVAGVDVMEKRQELSLAS